MGARGYFRRHAVAWLPATVLAVLTLSAGAAHAESAHTRVAREIRALAAQDAANGQMQTVAAVTIERDNAAGLTPAQVAQIYVRAYTRVDERLHPRDVWDDVRAKLPWAAVVLAVLAAIFRDTLLRWVNGLIGLGERFMIRRLAGNRRMRRRALARYGTWLLDGTSRVALPFREEQHLDIDDVIVPLRIVATETGGPLTAEEALLAHQRVVLTGEPGSGKSMTIRHLAREAARGLVARAGGRTPVLIELRDMGATPVRDRVVATLAAGGFPKPEAFVDRALDGDGMVVLLDGLDEVVSSEREVVLQGIRTFVAAHPRCRVVVTCRTAVYRGGLDDLIDRRLALDELDDQQVTAFLARWEPFMPAGKSSRQLLQSLRDHPRLMGSARNPLLLTMIAHLYTHVEHYVLPHSRAEFYESATRLLLSEWRAQPNQFQQPEKRKALRELALRSQAAPAEDGDLATFSLEDALEELRAVLPAVGRSPDEARRMLDEIVERSGLLVALDGGERFRFTHQTFQEFLAADKLREQPDDLLARFERDPDAWREVVKLWCGLADDATHVVRRVEAVEPVSALECLADAANIAPDAAALVMAPLRAELCSGTASTAVERAFGAVASDPHQRGRAVFDELGALLDEATTPAATAAIARALSHTNLSAAAQLLTARCATQPEVREPLVRLGDLAVPELREVVATDGDAAWAVAALHQIATPDAACALVRALDPMRVSAGVAAWALASLLADPAIRHELAGRPLPTPLVELGAPLAWVWEPFAEVDADALGLAPLVGAILSLMRAHQRAHAQRPIEPRIATAFLALAPGFAAAVDPSATASAELIECVDDVAPRLRARSTRSPRSARLHASDGGSRPALREVLQSGLSGIGHAPSDGERFVSLAIRDAAKDPDPWLCAARSLRPFTAGQLVAKLAVRGPVTRAQWSAIVRPPEAFEKSTGYRVLLGAVGLLAVVAAAVALAAAVSGAPLLGAAALVCIACGVAATLVLDARKDSIVLGAVLLGLLVIVVAVVELAKDPDEIDGEVLMLFSSVGFTPAVVGTLSVALATVLPVSLIVVGWLMLITALGSLWAIGERRASARFSVVAGLFAPDRATPR